MQRVAVQNVHAQAVIAGKGLVLLAQELMQLEREGIGREAANLTHHNEHGILHGRICDGAKVPQPPGKQNVEILRHKIDLAYDHGLTVVGPQGCQQQHKLQGEADLGVVEYMLQTRLWLFSCLDDAQILPAVKVEVAVDEAIEVVRLLEAHGVGGIAQPAVKLGANAIEVFGLRVLFALADFGGVLAAQPRFEAIGFHFLARFVELANAVAPAGVGGGAFGFVDIGKQVALEHVGGAERQPTVVHGLEDGVGVVVGVGGYFN